VPACIFRERVNVGRAMTITTVGGEIRGSDVWTDWSGNTSTLAVPSLPLNGHCIDPRCAWPEQVFIDGVPQLQVATGSVPALGQFALDGSRHIVLGTSPVGRMVEVTTRQRWMTITAGGVTVSGFRMMHAASPPQDGGLTVQSVTTGAVLISGSVMSDTHGSVVNLMSSSNVTVWGGTVFRGGQEGFHISGGTDNAVRGVSIHDNNTEGFDAGWEAGGLKAAVETRLTLDGNEVYNNDSGLWCDIDCRDITVSNNQIHHNRNGGIFFEISTGARIFGNRVWESGWGFTAWGWGGAIVVSSGGSAEIYNNTVAWSADGIVIASQGRADRDPVTNNYIHDNVVVLSKMASDTSDQIIDGFLQDWAGPLYDAVSNNRGAANRYWSSVPDPAYCRFAWNGCISRLADFNATPGEEAGVYLSDTQKDSILTAAGIPTAPESH
jgi:parallel beta-helix repeat protein